MHSEDGPVRFLSRLHPGRFGQCGRACDLSDQLCGQLGRSLVIATDAPQQGTLLRRRVRLSRRVEEPASLGVYEHLVGESAQSRHLFGPARNTPLGHIRLPVPEKQTIRRVQIAYGGQPVLEPFVRGLTFLGHEPILASDGDPLFASEHACNRSPPVAGGAESSKSVKIAVQMKHPTRKFSTTPGTRDVLPPESTRLLDVQASIRERFRIFGYGEVLTPALEYSEVIEEPKLRDASFKLFDPDNQMLLLRPEMTTPIARLVAQRLRNFPPPYKLSYVLPVYRRASVGRGQSAELFQAGVEVVGSPSPQEDAATVALLVDVLSSLGLETSSDFAVVLGQTAFYTD